MKNLIFGGIEGGGTKFVCAVGSAEGESLAETRFPTTTPEETLGRAAALGLDPAAALQNNDAYPFFDALGDLLRPGPTRTNVNDLMVVFVR